MIKYNNRLIQQNSCGMCKYPTEAMDKVNEWFGHIELQIDYCWYDSNEMYIIITDDKKQFFLRLFTIDDSWELSQDKVIEIK